MRLQAVKCVHCGGPHGFVYGPDANPPSVVCDWCFNHVNAIKANAACTAAAFEYSMGMLWERVEMWRVHKQTMEARNG